MKKIDILNGIKEVGILGMPIDGLPVLLNAWIPNDQLFAYKINEDEGNIIVILERGEDKYDLLRLFPMGGEWHISQDLTNVSSKTIMKVICK